VALFRVANWFFQGGAEQAFIQDLPIAIILVLLKIFAGAARRSS
jgi:hypothetical protein